MLPLEGVRVLEFCSLIAGPLGPRILADHGAEVIKVESARRPDGFRAGGGFGGMTPEQLANRLCNFNAFNRSKLSVSLDMTHPQAREIAYQLVRTSDVVIDN
ncbi:MAG: CoA transferase, partial [Chloroflexi bacterium]|nr:CoA transferase [Chloroflexota bacterium]